MITPKSCQYQFLVNVVAMSVLDKNCQYESIHMNLKMLGLCRVFRMPVCV